MRACITVCVAVIALAASACGNGTPSTPTRTPTELSPLLAGTVTALAAPTRTPVPMASPDTSPPFTITGPMDQAVALTQDTLLRAGNYFVLDLQSRLVYVITPLPRPPDSGGRVGISVRWLSENELGVAGTDAILYAVKLDGSVSRVGSRAEPTAAPAQALSADRAWSAAMDLGQNYADVVVAPAGGMPAFRIKAASSLLWSPLGHQLALSGNLCGRFDRFIFDPAGAVLRNVAEARSESVLSVEWRPDGMALAAEVIDLRSGSNRRFLGLVDVQTGSIEPLVEIPALGTLAPVAWNTSGDRLLFQFRGGRGCDSPELPPRTTLEVLP